MAALRNVRKHIQISIESGTNLTILRASQDYTYYKGLLDTDNKLELIQSREARMVFEKITVLLKTANHIRRDVSVRIIVIYVFAAMPGLMNNIVSSVRRRMQSGVGNLLRKTSHCPSLPCHVQI